MKFIYNIMDTNDIKYGTIYIMKNFVTNKYYIGQTIQTAQERFKQHIRESKNEGRKEYNYAISKAIREYGEEAFDYGILSDTVPIEDLDLIEEHYIDMYNTADPEFGYNMSIGGNDTSNYREYPKTEEKNYIKDISEEDINNILEQL